MCPSRKYQVLRKSPDFLGEVSSRLWCWASRPWVRPSWTCWKVIPPQKSWRVSTQSASERTAEGCRGKAWGEQLAHPHSKGRRQLDNGQRRRGSQRCVARLEDQNFDSENPLQGFEEWYVSWRNRQARSKTVIFNICQKAAATEH